MGFRGFLYNKSYTNISAAGSSDPVTVQQADVARIDISVTTVTAGSIQFTVESLDGNGNWQNLTTFTAINSAPTLANRTIGAGCEINKVIGNQLRISWTIVTGPINFQIAVLAQ